VGNVLNSMNVSVTLMREHLRKSKAANLIKVVELFRQHRGELGDFITRDPRGKMIPGYLEQLSAQLVKESNDALQVVELVTRSMEHIKKIVAMQQSYGKVAGVAETLPAATLIEDALQINAAGLERHGIKVVRDYADVPPVTVDKHKVLQILINLVRNAKHALDESGREQRVLRLGLARNGNERLKITVADNGVGIEPENLTRIFAHGFTTRKDGHGFGLHSGALAAKELGGSLTVQSDGPGRGAIFTLELPFGSAGANP
jgi:signal transduction histidine kinase